MERLENAIKLIKHYHKNQKRDDGKDYEVHLTNVFHLLTLVGTSYETQLAGLLHDILEDTDCKEKEIKDKFGYTVLLIVKELTNDPITKLPPIKSKEAWLIKFCDIIDNCTDMNTWDLKRIRKYLNKKRKLLELR